MPLSVFHTTSDQLKELRVELKSIQQEVLRGFRSEACRRQVYNNPIKAKSTADARHSLATFCPMELQDVLLSSNIGLLKIVRYLREVVCPRPAPLLLKADINVHYRLLRVRLLNIFIRSLPFFRALCHVRFCFTDEREYFHSLLSFFQLALSGHVPTQQLVRDVFV